MSTLKQEGKEVYDRTHVHVAVLGKSGVGKTTFSYRVLHPDAYNFKPYCTLGIEYKDHEFCVAHPSMPSYLREVEVMIWDTAGTESHHSIMASYYKHKQVAIFMYAVDDGDSFESIFNNWLPKFVAANNQDIVMYCLIGTKTDCVKDMPAFTGVEGNPSGDPDEDPNLDWKSKDMSVIISFEESVRRCLEEEKKYDNKVKFHKIAQVSNTVHDGMILRKLFENIVAQVAVQLPAVKEDRKLGPNPLRVKNATNANASKSNHVVSNCCNE